MIFFLRAAFWTAAVAAFVPAGFNAPLDGPFARNAEIIAASALHGDMMTGLQDGGVCEGRESLCETLGEFANFAGWAASIAGDRIESAVETQLAQHAPASPADASRARNADEIFAAAAAAETPAR